MQVADLPLPSLAVAVMVAVPLPFAVTLPLASTVATEVLEDFQLTDLSVASVGRTVGAKVRVPSIARKVYWVLSIVMDVTNLLTVTAQDADFPLPSLAVAVIVAVPLDTAVTLPLWSTVATDVLSEDQVTDLSLALLGEIVAVNVTVCPSLSVTEDLLSEIPVTF